MIKHKLNDAFDWQERNGPFRIISNDQAAQYNRDGFIVMEDIFSSETVASLLSELDPLEERSTAYLREHMDDKGNAIQTVEGVPRRP